MTLQMSEIARVLFELRLEGQAGGGRLAAGGLHPAWRMGETAESVRGGNCARFLAIRLEWQVRSRRAADSGSPQSGS